jgi:hypothetical protein
MEKNDRIQTLQQLIEAITEREGRKSTGMLRTLRGYIEMAANKHGQEIRVTELADLGDVLSLYLARRKEEGYLHGNRPRSYMNYFRILLKKAQKYTAALYSPEISESWKPILEAVRTTCSCRGVVKAAIQKGIRPQDYSDADLNRYCDERRKLGRHPFYLRQVARAFRDGVIEAGLTGLLFKLTYPRRRETYGVRLEDFPEPLRTQRNGVVDWKLHLSSREGRHDTGVAKLL